MNWNSRNRGCETTSSRFYFLKIRYPSISKEQPEYYTLNPI